MCQLQSAVKLRGPTYRFRPVLKIGRVSTVQHKQHGAARCSTVQHHVCPVNVVRHHILVTEAALFASHVSYVVS